MSQLASDLLQQAEHLATLDERRPKQANLRRAISSAYYALFHLLVSEASLRLSPRSSPEIAARIARAFAHAEMKQVCRSVWTGTLSDALTHLQPVGFSPELRLVAQRFVALQEARHGADYDLELTYDRLQTEQLIALSREAFSAWKKVRNHDEANVFLCALLLNTRWSK